MDEKPVLQSVVERWRLLAREQKISASILGICGIAAFALSIQRVGAAIRDPFTVSREKFLQARQEVDSITPEQKAMQEAQRRDTDGDGISDYEEEQLIGTSPYLRDTDGDGAPDNTELAQGTNPNCMTGQVCASPTIDFSLLATSSAFLNPTIPDPGVDFIASFQRGLNDQKQKVREETGSTSTEYAEALVRDPSVIRKLLQDSGKVDAETLAKITDQQLLQIYDQAALEAARKDKESISL